MEMDLNCGVLELSHRSFHNELQRLSHHKQVLRRDYESLLNAVLHEHRLSLADLFGGTEVVEPFWINPNVEQQPKEIQGEWHVPLNACTILSHDGE